MLNNKIDYIIKHFNAKNSATCVLVNEPMSKHTSYKIGGKAALFAKISDVDTLQFLLNLCKKVDLDYFVVGRGSNLLVSDDGFNGLIISLDGQFKDFTFDKTNQTYTAGSAVLLSKIVAFSKKNFHSGFEFAVGTPGTIGGAVKMNAGTRTSWIGSVCKNIKVLNTKDMQVYTLDAKDVQWSYRSSSIKPYEIVLEAKFRVKILHDDKSKTTLVNTMEEKLQMRKKSQDLSHPSCGSVFKNPQNVSAGQLIDSLDLKSFIHGGAKISDKHANFIVNIDNARASDVVFIINKIQKMVYDTYKIKLVPEVKFLGFKKQCSIF